MAMAMINKTKDIAVIEYMIVRLALDHIAVAAMLAPAKAAAKNQSASVNLFMQ